VDVDLTSVRASFGIEDESARLTHRELRARREAIRQNLGARRPRQRR
jgi:hypothetical protein